MARRTVGFCGIDIGTQGVRVCVVSASGHTLGGGSAPLPPGQRHGVQHEQQPADWWPAVVTATRLALADTQGVEIEAVALDATSGTVLVEASDGTPAGPALMYDDARAQQQAARAQHEGAQLWQTLGYRMQPAWALPKAMWLQDNGAVRPGDRIVHQSDHVLRQLVGRPVATDTSHALKTGCDLITGTWPWPILEPLGLTRVQLPELVRPGTVLGGVCAQAAAATRLREGTPVRAGMTDGCAAQIAASALHPGRWSSALGTTLVVKGSTSQLVRDPTGAVYSHRHPDGGWLPGGASSTGAGVLACVNPDGDPQRFAALTDEARSLIPMPGVTYPLAGRGERFPFVASTAEGFLAEEARTPATRFAAMCQGIAYLERLAYDVLRVRGAEVDGTVAFSGGAARNGWWNQLRADVLGRPAVVPASTQAATGMAILAAAPPGRLAATAQQMVRSAARYEPDPERGEALRPGYVRLVDAFVDRGWLPAHVADAVLAGGQ
jgi:D-ribulokinase